LCSSADGATPAPLTSTPTAPAAERANWKSVRTCSASRTSHANAWADPPPAAISAATLSTSVLVRAAATTRAPAAGQLERHGAADALAGSGDDRGASG